MTSTGVQMFTTATASIESDKNFLRAWEQRQVPFPTTAGHITRVRQILRACGKTILGDHKQSRAITRTST
jgi:hypothetical protein